MIRTALAAALMTTLAGCAASAGVNGDTGTEVAAAGMTDPAIAAMASVTNQGEIAASRLALERAQNASVREFAQLMVDEHTRAEQQMQSLLESQRLPKLQDAHAQAAIRSNEQTLATLRGLSGAAFDRAYTDAQVALHRWTLESLEQSLIPSARNDALEGFLEGMAPKVRSHLEMATRIQGELGN